MSKIENSLRAWSPTRQQSKLISWVSARLAYLSRTVAKLDVLRRPIFVPSIVFSYLNQEKIDVVRHTMTNFDQLVLPFAVFLMVSSSKYS